MSRLLDEVRDAVRTRHYSTRTEEAYIRWIREYTLFFGKRHPAELGAKNVSAFLSHLAVSAGHIA